MERALLAGRVVALAQHRGTPASDRLAIRSGTFHIGDGTAFRIALYLKD